MSPTPVTTISHCDRESVTLMVNVTLRLLGNAPSSGVVKMAFVSLPFPVSTTLSQPDADLIVVSSWSESLSIVSEKSLESPPSISRSPLLMLLVVNPVVVRCREISSFEFPIFNGSAAS